MEMERNRASINNTFYSILTFKRLVQVSLLVQVILGSLHGYRYFYESTLTSCVFHLVFRS
ncbi:hypothetical protein HanRHA438_Chr05g0215911 [Helianthus annuus]|nr:hypothetical protein HanRHA438_Chr05g0215911 [Helianthus annuus]